MRLLHTRTLEMHEFHGSNMPPHAILSHRWSSEEIQFEDRALLRQKVRTQTKAKILDFCKKAAERNLDYAWVDTCCIAKSSSAELTESINSMFDWYRDAKVCFVYLADVALPLLSKRGKRDKQDLPLSLGAYLSRSDWFKRGWTLQELVAPRELEFYSFDWQLLGTKFELKDTLSSITGIDEDILLGADIARASVAKRMFWASHRVTTRLEDIAYSLLGIWCQYAAFVW
ncbi:heterokaryon incompatibility protein-domain-containing protein [Lophiotrema nucula]|uniref:Heterokaryon incompatibility protein-domain-containing protein n=1 Tax=Lophiotrema nucula TaxID=690887 RepID=A0A6A5Z8W8_9PLEO|nr:heterokaryon incompatibility protein-domain-containing protein [Lophiotrema nucula]